MCILAAVPRSTTVAATSSAAASTANSSRQLKSSNEESPQRKARQIRHQGQTQGSTVNVTNGPLKAQCIRFALGEALFVHHRMGIVTNHQANSDSIAELPEELNTTIIENRDEYHQTANPNAKRYVVALEEGKTPDLSSLMTRIISSDVREGQETCLAQSRPASMAYLRGKCYTLEQGPRNQNLFGGLEAIPGLFLSVRLASSRQLVDMNPSMGAFYKSVRLDRSMDDWDAASTCPKRWAQEDLNKLQTFLKSLLIKALRLTKKDCEGKRRPWIERMHGLAQIDDDRGKKPIQESRDETPVPQKIKFPGADPSEVQSWHDKKNNYFQEEYPEHPPCKDLPESRSCVANAGNRERPILLPAEVCQILSGQAYRKKYPPQQTIAMTKVVVRRPADHKKDTERRGLQSMGLIASTHQKLHSFGLELPGSRLRDAQAQQFPFATVMYANGSEPELSTKFPRMFIMNLMEFETPAEEKPWTHIRILDQSDTSDDEDTNQAELIARAFQQQLCDHGMRVSLYTAKDQKDHQLTSDQQGSAVIAPLKIVLNQLSRPDAHFLLIILPDKDLNRYSKLKLFCDSKFGMKSICVFDRTNHWDQQKLSNLCLEANLKVGGVNFVAPAKALDFIWVGMDLTHPSTNPMEGLPSIAAIVASMDPELAQWPAKLRIQ
ncbi:MAG: hypothetical protein Q9192_007375 [Flavoplaca navasiana]